MKNTANPSETPKAVSENIIIQQVEKELLIYNTSDHQTVLLNEPVAVVWNLCDGTRTLGEIKQAASKALNSKLTDEYLLFTLSELNNHNLLDKTEAPASSKNLNNLSRREVVRRIGLTTAVALPVIASLAAPAATNAQSNLRPINATCQRDAQCQSTCCITVCRPIDDCFI